MFFVCPLLSRYITSASLTQIASCGAPRVYERPSAKAAYGGRQSTSVQLCSLSTDRACIRFFLRLQEVKPMYKTRNQFHTKARLLLNVHMQAKMQQMFGNGYDSG